MPRSLAASLLRLSLLALMSVGAGLITASSLPYFQPGVVSDFVLEKLPEVRFQSLWLASLRIHVAAALIAFPLCIALMTRFVQRRPALHRWLGRVAGVLVLFAMVPSGAILALDAKGGAIVTAGFLVSGALMAWFMVTGVIAARRRVLGAHRRAMLHVFAQMSVAVTSRALMIALDAAAISPSVAYVVALWVPVLASAAIAELASLPSGFVSRSWKRMGHVFSKVGWSLRARDLVRPFVRLGR